MTKSQRILFEYRRNEKGFKRFLDSKYQSSTERESAGLQKEYEQKQKRCVELDKIISKLYEDSVLGRISENRFESMSMEYEREQEEIRKALPELKIRIEHLKEKSNSADKFINVIRKYTIIDKLDAAILNELIDKIIVHHKEKSEDGSTYQQIEIFYRFIGKLDN